MKPLLTLFALIGVLCGNAASAGNWVSAPAGSTAGLMERLDRAHWIATGARSSTRVVYVFVDPDCPFCNDLWKAMKTARAPDVQIRSLLVAVIDTDSRGKDAAILESRDPAQALEDHERRFERGGIAPKSARQPQTGEVIAANEALMQALHIFGTPGIVYRDENGEVKVFAGMPDSQQLQTIVGKRVTPTAGQQRPVIELFTSQGCSSCPPADALVGRLIGDPSVLALSYHVNYWDGAAWTDSFASRTSTDRQYAYARAQRQSSVFTPQIMVNGTQSLVGSRESDIRSAIAAAPKSRVNIEISKASDGRFNAVLDGPDTVADVWEVRFVRHVVTRIRGGENGGRELESFNNVVGIRRIGSFAPGMLQLAPLRQPEDGIALLVQKPGAGPILGAAAL